jgi:hypothetical protein
MITWDDLVNLFLYGIRTETLRKFLNNQHKSKGDQNGNQSGHIEKQSRIRKNC